MAEQFFEIKFSSHTRQISESIDKKNSICFRQVKTTHCHMFSKKKNSIGNQLGKKLYRMIVYRIGKRSHTSEIVLQCPYTEH